MVSSSLATILRSKSAAAAVMRVLRQIVLTAVLVGSPLQAFADIPSPGPRPPRPVYPPPAPDPAPVPRPSTGPCAGKAAGDVCEIAASSADSPSTVGQCVPTTCPTPQPPGLQYSCLDCEASSAAATGSLQPASGFAADSAAAQGGGVPADSGSAQRVWISMLLGAIALGGGVMLLFRNARRRRN